MYLHDFDELSDNVFSPEARQTFVPNGGQKLLNAGVSHEGLLLVLDGELQPLQSLDVPDLPRVTVRVVVEDNLQLEGRPRVIDQTSHKLLHLLPQPDELFLVLRFSFCQPLQLVRKLKGGQNGIFGTQGN